MIGGLGIVADPVEQLGVALQVAPGAISSPVISFSGEVAISSRPLRIAASRPTRSCSVERKLKRIAGGIGRDPSI